MVGATDEQHAGFQRLKPMSGMMTLEIGIEALSKYPVKRFEGFGYEVTLTLSTQPQKKDSELRAASQLFSLSQEENLPALFRR